MADNQTTICAIATPPGRGGVGIVRISGPKARAIAREVSGVDPVPRQVQYCLFKDQNNNAIDDGIMLYFKAPASFTGEDVVEFQGHGGQVVLNMLQNRIIRLGATYARPGEFTERAFLNHKIDLLQAEAVADLIDSVSEQAARSATRSLQGEFSERITGLQEDLINLRVYVEGALDFTEEEIDFFEDNKIQEKLKMSLVVLEDILGKAHYGKILNEGVQAVIIGRPNVGKSSLLNRLSMTDRAIVTEQPGTTRDVVQDRILVKGISVTVSDTAGIRETEDSIEREGIRRALAETDKADIILLVMEYGDSQDDFSYLKNKLKNPGKILIVKNKIDLTSGKAKVIVGKNGVNQIYLSAKTGEGIDLLEDYILKTVIDEFSEENAILARARHIDALTKVKKNLQDGLTILEDSKSSELLAAELNEAQHNLAQITGEYVADDLLGEIFSRFCIGK